MTEQHIDENQSCDEDEQSYSTDEDESISDNDYESNDNCPTSKAPRNEITQHILAIIFAVLAAVATHAQIHGGYDAWKNELHKDWLAIRSSFTMTRSSSTDITHNGNIPRAASTARAPHAAPSMNSIPSELRQKFLQKAMEYHGHDYRHARAKHFRRTADLRFCTPMTNTGVGKNSNLVDLDFIIPLEPSVRVLHAYYLGDALGLDSSFMYDNVDTYGGYDSDVILKDIDDAYNQDGNENEGLSLERIQSILESHLGKSLVNDEHACFLQQYTANKQSGRSIRGRTVAYDRPHVSSFYRTKEGTTSVMLASREQNSKILPASLTFTGFAAKFINLSNQALNLYWDGGHIPSGPKAGQIHTSLVGIIPSMESIGTASFPGHSFFITPIYDKEHMLKRWTVTEDEAVLYYDPLEDLSVEEQNKEVQKFAAKQKFARDAWIVNRSFSRDYLVATGRHYLSVFPQPTLNDSVEVIDKSSDTGISMWNAAYLGQSHTVETSELYFTDVPDELPRLTKDDFQPNIEISRRLETKKYQSSQVKGKFIGSNSTIHLELKVVSCAPPVLEVKKFLSPVEVQHLIDLASGAKGDVSMGTSTVMASGVDDKKSHVANQATRSSRGGWIHREQDAIVDGIFRRVSDLLNIDERLMRDQRPPHLIGADNDAHLPTHDRIVEAMQLLRYGPGEQYTAHHDFTYPSIENRYQPKRYATVLLYLTGEGDVIEDGIRRSRSKGSNDNGLEGGETIFPRAITREYHDGVKIRPQSGKAVLFYNVLIDGNMDDLSQHSGGKVTAGVKYIANIWIHDPIIS